MADQGLVELARAVGDALRRKGWRIATAESCTGGLVGHLLTEIPGSSAYFPGGVIAYDNAVKRDLLQVRSETLASAGAVSETCAREMAAGAARLFATEAAIATTGIAGPGGGTAEKPVGLVYIAVYTPDGAACERHLFGNDRAENKILTAQSGLQMLLAALQR